jgi:pyruvate dehydrogenase E2 component (dihydrolipoamide acetyltransferase)
MATNILMPALSPTMTEGTLARWLKHEGDAVKSGDVLAEIETDKATMEVEAVDEGILGKILVPDGTAGVAVNAPIAVLVEDGEAVPDQSSVVSRQSSDKAPVDTLKTDTPATAPAKTPEQAKAGPLPEKTREGGPKTASEALGKEALGREAPARGNGQDHGERVFASPLARRMAQQAGIDLASLKGSGPNGRIVKADIEEARGKPQAAPQPAQATPQPAPQQAARQPAAPPPAAPQPAAPPAPAITAPHEAIPHSSMRKVIAQRMVAAKQAIPEFTVAIDVDLDALLKLRADLNARSPKDGPAAFKLSVNDLIIKAAAVTMRRVPAMNASFTPEAMIRYKEVDISVAVAIPQGLITPLIRNADQKGLATISNEMKDLAARAKAGKLKPEEFQGGTFSISNLGMFGLRHFTAIINPPQAAILAVAAGTKRAVVKNDQLAVATMMTATLSCDHRVVDGATGAEWLAAFKTLVEEPLGLML